MQQKINIENDYKRIDSCLAQLTQFSRSHIKNAIDNGNVLLNGKVVKANKNVCAGDEVIIEIVQPKPLDVKPVDIPLDIVYQDQDVVVINKPQGLTVHAGSGTDDNTLVNALLYNIDNLSGINGVIRPGIVHRIDKDTSGLLVVAKNDKSHVSLAKQIEIKQCKRIYLALLEGNVKCDNGTIDTLIDRNPKDRTAFCVSNKGKRAITDYKVITRYEGYTLCEFSLHTGRTHQIRVHSKYLGNPIVGDRVYGFKKQAFKLNGQLLHAYKICFNHPSTNQLMTFTAPLPEYFVNVLNKLKKV